MLALELALIRWIGGQIRIVAYFSNIVLLAAFLGMGLGVVLGRTRPGIVHAALPALAVVSLVLAFSTQLGIMSVPFPDPTLTLWGGEAHDRTLPRFVGATAFMVLIFWTLTAVFALLAAPLGARFGQLPAARAYAADIVGSLFGVLAMTLLAVVGTTPAAWLAPGAIAMLWFSRRMTSLVSAAVIVLAGSLSVRGALFSPYNRIDLEIRSARTAPSDPLRRDWSLYVNRDYHQRILDLRSERIAREPEPDRTDLANYQAAYELAFRTIPGRSALIVGAGAGNDAAAALRAGYRTVTAVEIDPVILDLGEALHPENPYADPRVVRTNDDARAFFERYRGPPFDVISYGLLDSHAMFSAMSSLRLENFVYTAEGIRAAWENVADGGVLSISFSLFAGPWIEQRMLRTVQEATGIRPVVVRHGMDHGVSFLVRRGAGTLAIPARWSTAVDATPRLEPGTRATTDVWPFLYLRPDSIPWGYLTVLVLVALTSIAAVRKVYGPRSMFGAGFDLPMFLLGAGFMLLETRAVTQMSLLLGSTWIVNSAVFGGILLMILFATLIVMRGPVRNIELWFIPLFAALLIVWASGGGVLNGLPIIWRGVAGGILFALPIAFAGIIFASLLARSPDPVASLGANLIGALLGGLLEYSSMAIGLRSVALLALLMYLGSFLVLRRRNRAVGSTKPVAAEPNAVGSYAPAAGEVTRA